LFLFDLRMKSKDGHKETEFFWILDFSLLFFLKNKSIEETQVETPRRLIPPLDPTQPRAQRRRGKREEREKDERDAETRAIE